MTFKENFPFITKELKQNKYTRMTHAEDNDISFETKERDVFGYTIIFGLFSKNNKVYLSDLGWNQDIEEFSKVSTDIQDFLKSKRMRFDKDGYLIMLTNIKDVKKDSKRFIKNLLELMEIAKNTGLFDEMLEDSFDPEDNDEQE